MLVEIKRLDIANDGYKRKVSISRMYINVDHIISIKDYEAVESFLLREEATDMIDKKFCLVNISNGDKVDQIIALGTSEEMFSRFNSASERKLLNG